MSGGDFQGAVHEVDVEAAPVVAARERTLLILGGSLDHLGGVEAFCERSAQALAKRGGWRTERIATSTAYLTFRRVPAFLHGIRQLIHHRRHRPDVAWLQYVNLPDLAYLVVAKLLGMRVMVTPHLGSNWRSQNNPFLRWLSASTLRLADRLSLISWTQEVEIILPSSVPRSLIRNFLPAELLDAPLLEGSALPANEVQIIHSSRLSEGKGTFLVVEACARLRDAGVPFHTRITGGADQQTMTRLHNMIAEYGLGEHISVLGRVSEPDLFDHLRRSDVLVHLSRIDSYPLIILEAMTCSAVPVVMELAGARNMVETYRGHIVSAANAVEETTDWLKQCDLAVLRRERVDVAMQVRTDYGWNRCAAALVAALDACIAGDRAVTQPEAAIKLTP